MSKVKNVTADNFGQEVLQASQPVMLDFWAPWCSTCKMLSPVVETLADENAGRLNIGKVNVGEDKDLAVQLGIRGMPTLVFFNKGQEVKRIVGAQGKSQLQKVIDEVVDDR